MLSQTIVSAEDSLIETIPSWVVQRSITAFGRVAISTGIGFCCLLIALLGREAEVGWDSAIVVGVCLMPPCLLFAIGCSAALRHELTTRTPTIELNRSTLTVRYGETLHSAPVKDCSFRRGRAYMMRLPACPKLRSSQAVILIDFPPSLPSTKAAWLWGNRVRVAVGYTDEMRSKWESALLGCLKQD